MKKVDTKFQAEKVLAGKTLGWWRVAQALVWLLGLGFFGTLLLAPDLGVMAFWNVLIPVAPALFVLSTGLWRNICPLATVSLLPRHLGFSQGRRLSLAWQGNFHLAGVCLLYLIVPLRHLVLNTNGLATAGVLGVVTLSAFVSGYFFEWKSGWCSSLCPVHPVERLYGEKVLFSPPNAHCRECHNCVIPCPDSTPGMNPLLAKHRRSQQIAAALVVGGLPGFIWGWFHVQDVSGSGKAWQYLPLAYGLPLLGLALTLAVYVVLSRYRPLRIPLLTNVFAAAAVACYYWYRLPGLFGFGLFPGDGMLVDLRQVAPAWSITTTQLAEAAFFGWWIVLRRPAPAVWAIRPPFEKTVKKI